MIIGEPSDVRVEVTCNVETKCSDFLRPKVVMRRSSSVLSTFAGLSTLYG
jgi:hypothetical protein